MKYPMRMLSALLSVSLFCAYLMVGSAFAQNFDFPSNPTLNQIVTGPGGQQFQWDGTKWIAMAGSATAYLPVASPTYTGLMTGPTLNLTGTTAPQLQISNTFSSISFGSSTTAPQATLFSVSPFFEFMTTGAHYNGTNYVADSTGASILQQGAGGWTFYDNSGLTVGNTFTPTPVVLLGPTGINLATGATYQIGGSNVFASGTFLPTVGGSTTNPTASYLIQAGYVSFSGPIEYIYFRVALTNVAGGAGILLINFGGATSGAQVQPCLPINVGTGNTGQTAQYAPGAIQWQNIQNIPAGYAMTAQANPGANSAQIVISNMGGSGANSSLGVANLTTDSDLYGSYVCRWQ